MFTTRSTICSLYGILKSPSSINHSLLEPLKINCDVTDTFPLSCVAFINYCQLEYAILLAALIALALTPVIYLFIIYAFLFTLIPQSLPCCVVSNGKTCSDTLCVIL